LIRTLLEKFDGGSAGIETLAVAAGQAIRVVDMEPLLPRKITPTTGICQIFLNRLSDVSAGSSGEDRQLKLGFRQCPITQDSVK
jgi:hypothetical protein